MEISFELNMISLPNELNFKTAPDKRQDGFSHKSNIISVKDLTEEQAYEYAEEIKHAFVYHWGVLSGLLDS